MIGVDRDRFQPSGQPRPDSFIHFLAGRLAEGVPDGKLGGRSERRISLPSRQRQSLIESCEMTVKKVSRLFDVAGFQRNQHLSFAAEGRASFQGNSSAEIKRAASVVEKLVVWDPLQACLLTQLTKGVCSTLCSSLARENPYGQGPQALQRVASEVAERVGFEPTVPFQARRISSAVHSTTLPPLQGVFGDSPGAGLE